MDRAGLYTRLQDRPTDAAGAKAFDDALEAELSQTVAILVTDLSGFTRLTRKHGIVHFLSIFQRAVRLASTQIANHGGHFLKTAADNTLALFSDPGAALAAARAMLADADEHNAGYPEDAQVRLCAGIGYGEMLVMDDEAFGDDLNVAFKLGEDVAEPFEILISEKAVTYLRAHGIDEDQLDGPRSEVLGGVDLVHYAAR